MAVVVVIPNGDVGVEYRKITFFNIAEGYAAGNDGSIWGCRPNNSWKPLCKLWHKLKPINHANGYLTVCLRENTKYRKYRSHLIHKLILAAFVGLRSNGQEARHLDGNNQNNKIDNLCYGTKKENEEDKIKHGTIACGEKQGSSKLTRKQVIEIRQRAVTGELQRIIGASVGVRQTTIHKIVTRKLWKHVA